ncbi:MAG: metallophosphoesterase [Thermodesulfobacteriota bacterium]
MKLHILSDLHIEFGDFNLPEVGADVIILAGDIHVGDRGLKWILEQRPQPPVIYVPGNHEFYHYKFPGLIDELREKSKGTNVHLLENDALEFNGYRFFGCTLWSDMDLFGNPDKAMDAAAGGMNDYHVIRNSHTDQVLTPGETVKWHAKSVRKLEKFIEAGNPEKSMVITHCTPSIKSIPHRFQGHAMTPAFASNMEEFILKHQLRLWIHGHTHDSFDYCLGETRIICNPRGYVPNALNPQFEPDLTITI